MEYDDRIITLVLCVTCSLSTNEAEQGFPMEVAGRVSPSDLRASLENIPMHPLPLGNGSDNPRQEKTLRKGPFVYREYVTLTLSHSLCPTYCPTHCPTYCVRGCGHRRCPVDVSFRCFVSVRCFVSFVCPLVPFCLPAVWSV